MRPTHCDRAPIAAREIRGARLVCPAGRPPAGRTHPDATRGRPTRTRRRRADQAAGRELADDRGLDLEPIEQRAQPRAGGRAEPVDALAEDQLVLRRVLPADQLGDRDLVAVGLEHERADHVRQVRAELAAMQRVREQRRDRRIVGPARARAGARPRPGSTARPRRDRRRCAIASASASSVAVSQACSAVTRFGRSAQRRPHRSRRSRRGTAPGRTAPRARRPARTARAAPRSRPASRGRPGRAPARRAARRGSSCRRRSRRSSGSGGRASASSSAGLSSSTRWRICFSLRRASALSWPSRVSRCRSLSMSIDMPSGTSGSVRGSTCFATRAV